MEETKISLSPSEFELVTNTEIILTKNRVLQKIQDSLGHLGNREQHFVEINHLSQLQEFSIGPKISKGENYVGLPYIILDYPRYSNGEDLFFIRHMFWWGHFFSSTLQVKGKCKNELIQGIQENKMNDVANSYFIGIQKDPWQHHFEPDNYKMISTVNHEELQQISDRQEYIKIATKWPLGDYNTINDLLFESWNYLLKISRLVA
jgi:hypothetical protein